MLTPTTGAQPVTVPLYDVGIHVPFGNQQFYSKNPTTVASSVLAHQGFVVLLGRDVLAECLLVYDGKHNTFTLAF